MNKSQAYSKLFELSNSGIDITEPINQLAVSESVPNSVLSFLSSYDKFGIEFIEKLKSKKFYKSVTESTDIGDQAKGLSSLITHLIIEIESNPSSRAQVLECIDTDKLIEGIRSYFTDDSSNLTESISYIKSLFKEGDQ